ncbi:hypothetical protein [Amycolatopsis sp. NPDC003676]
MRKGNWERHPVLHEAAGKVVRTAELEELGMSRSSIYRRCLPGGPWRRLLPGVVLLLPCEPDPAQQIEAALLRGGPDSMVTGLWAARLHGLSQVPEPDQIHLLVPDRRGVSSVGFTLVERTTRLPQPVVRNGIPVAPAYRAVLDAVRRIRDFDAVRALLAESVQRRRCTLEQLTRELSRGSQRGSALPRRALTALLAGTQSVAEADAWEVWKTTGLPEAEWNVVVTTGTGEFVARPDAWWDDVALAWEIDSRAWHEKWDGYSATLQRNARYAAAGIVVLQTLPIRLRTEPGQVAAELRAAHEAAARRPRPSVIRHRAA